MSVRARLIVTAVKLKRWAETSTDWGIVPIVLLGAALVGATFVHIGITLWP